MKNTKLSSKALAAIERVAKALDDKRQHDMEKLRKAAEAHIGYLHQMDHANQERRPGSLVDYSTVKPADQARRKVIQHTRGKVVHDGQVFRSSEGR